MQINIESYKDLLDFIQREDVNAVEASKIVCKALKVIQPYYITKEKLLELTTNYIDNFGQMEGEKPVMLCSRKTGFELKDMIYGFC